MNLHDHPNANARETYNHVRTFGLEIVERIDADEVLLTSGERHRLWVAGHFLAKAWCGAELVPGEDLPDPSVCPADPDYFLPWGRPGRAECRQWYQVVKTSLGTEFVVIVPKLLVTLEELHGEDPLLTPEEKEILAGPLSDFLSQGRTAWAQSSGLT